MLPMFYHSVLRILLQDAAGVWYILLDLLWTSSVLLWGNHTGHLLEVQNIYQYSHQTRTWKSGNFPVESFECTRAPSMVTFKFVLVFLCLMMYFCCYFPPSTCWVILLVIHIFGLFLFLISFTSKAERRPILPWIFAAETACKKII